MNFCRHTYGVWSFAFDQSVSSRTSTKMQARECTKCHKIQLRHIWRSAYVDSNIFNMALTFIGKKDLE